MLKAFKYRLYPNKEQAEKIDKNIGCARWIYNYALTKKMKAWNSEKKNLSRYDIQKDLPELKKQKETEWLKEADSKALIYSLLNLDNAYQKFFKEHKGYPKFKSKKKSKLNYTTYQKVKIDWDKNKLNLPKNKDIKIKLHRKFEGEAGQVTISKTPTGKYYVSILVDTKEKDKRKSKINEKTAIGIDLGIKTFATISDGRKIENPKILYKYEKKLTREYKRLSRKEKGSNNKNKQRIKVARTHERITNIRKDFLHKLSFELTHENQVKSIVLEDLNINGMLKNHHLSKAIINVSWNKFVELLAYKCDWYGVNLLKIGRFEPSSKLCSKCGFINQELTLSNREWTCPNCGSKLNRDLNAAINIKRFGLNPKIRQGLSESKPVEIA
jgi:putative transposase